MHDDVGAIRTPTGLVPRYQDLKRLFKETLNRGYEEEDYIKQFTVRVPENLGKIERLMDIYKTRVLDTPRMVFEILEEQRVRLERARERYGDYISPDKFLLVE